MNNEILRWCPKETAGDLLARFKDWGFEIPKNKHNSARDIIELTLINYFKHNSNEKQLKEMIREAYVIGIKDGADKHPSTSSKNNIDDRVKKIHLEVTNKVKANEVTMAQLRQVEYQGHCDFKAGLKLSQNPYDGNSLRFKHWKRGWASAHYDSGEIEIDDKKKEAYLLMF